MSQLDDARIIKEYRNQGKTFNDIGEILGKNSEACRSTLRRYESNLNNDIDILNILDKEFDFSTLKSKKAEARCYEINEAERLKHYGSYLIFSDLHIPYERGALIKDILLQPEVKKIDTCIIDGDLGQFEVAGKWPSETDDIITITLDRMEEILEVIASQFKKVIIIPGNHDLWCERELNRTTKNGLKELLKGVSPIQIVIDRLFEKGITNIEFTIQNELQLGNVMIAHPNEFVSTTGQTVIRVAEGYLVKNRDLSAVIIGHTHNVFTSLYRNVAVYEIGCLCHVLEYKKKNKMDRNVWVPAYGIFTIKPDGDLDVGKSRVIAMV